MSNHIFYTKDGTPITLKDTPLGSGGEGKVYEIKDPSYYASDFVAKIYLAPKLANQSQGQSYEDRITYMIDNPPSGPNIQQGNNDYIWPVEALYDDKQAFHGFIMHKAEGIELKKLLTDANATRINELDSVWKKFQLDIPSTLPQRAELCNNIAKAIHSIHQDGRYVVGDIKPDNIVVTPSGHVRILDLDSCQISENNNVLFESKMQTPQYSPPESDKPFKEQSWDLFILGVIFYEILCNIHPFNSGTVKSSFPNANDINTISAKIAHGLFAHGKNNVHLENTPPPHKNYAALPPKLKVLFELCLDEGVAMPQRRPRTDLWIQYLSAKPSIISFKLDKIVAIKGIELTISWEVENAESVQISPRIGTVKKHVDSQVIVLNGQEQHFELTATNLFGSSKKVQSLRKFPTPIIEGLTMPTPTFHIGTSVNITPPPVINWNSVPSVDQMFSDPKYNTPKPTPFIKKYNLDITQAIQKLYDNVKSILNSK